MSDHSDLVTQLLEAIIPLSLTYLIKLFFVPFSVEARLIARLISKFALWLLKISKRYATEKVTPEIDTLAEKLQVLRQNFKKSRIKLG